MAPSYKYDAVVVGIHDGDTITVAIDCGFRMTYTTPVRFYGIDSPELSTDAGKVARDFMHTLLVVGDPVVVETFKNPEDKYGRWLANVYIKDGPDTFNTCLNQEMIKNKHAVAYFGGKKTQ